MGMGARSVKPSAGLGLMTVRSRPEPKPKHLLLNRLSPPGALKSGGLHSPSEVDGRDDPSPRMQGER